MWLLLLIHWMKSLSVTIQIKSTEQKFKSCCVVIYKKIPEEGNEL